MTLVREVSIENFKSIRKLSLELGRVNVLIGANGSGKSNVLEAIAYGSAAARNKLENEYLVPRGIRVTEPRFMRSAFPGSDAEGPVAISLQRQGEHQLHLAVDPERRTLASPWQAVGSLDIDAFVEMVIAELEKKDAGIRQRAERLFKTDEFLGDLAAKIAARVPPDFLIYAPENSALRVFQAEPQILPLGIKGEGLFAHLKALGAPGRADRLAAIGDRLALLDWFERLEIPKDLAPGERSILIRDRYVVEGALFDQRSANEGFLFLLFYLTLFISPSTPPFFAIDNVDASLNPKLVTTMVEQLVALAKEHDKQVIFTTHNPAVLDGIDLGDDEQRLFVTERGKDGATRARRVEAPKPLDGDAPVPLSEAFVRGYLGGLPKSF
jgi:AAA domain, putative AbiEii toxin, Type IV TA system/AAA ATPase domain